MPTTSINDNCIPVWEQQLEGAVNQLAVKTAEFEEQTAAFADISNWVSQLEECISQMDGTDAKSGDILSVLELFLSQADIVCENVICLKDGVKILYCDIYHLTQCVEQLHGHVLKLKNDIDCLNNPMLTPESSVFVKCLTDLQVQIEKVLEMYEQMITEILDAIKIIYKLDCLLCNKDFGLIKKLTDMILYFGGEVDEKFCGTDAGHEGGQKSDSSKTICSETLEKPGFPLSNSDFYGEMQLDLASANTEKNTCKEQLDEITKDKVKLEACKSSLENAIEEATKARDVK